MRWRSGRFEGGGTSADNVLTLVSTLIVFTAVIRWRLWTVEGAAVDNLSPNLEQPGDIMQTVKQFTGVLSAVEGKCCDIVVSILWSANVYCECKVETIVL